MKRIEYESKTYTVRYAYRSRDGTVYFVCDTTELFGPRGDEVEASKVSAVGFNDTVLYAPEKERE